MLVIYVNRKSSVYSCENQFGHFFSVSVKCFMKENCKFSVFPWNSVEISLWQTFAILPDVCECAEGSECVRVCLHKRGTLLVYSYWPRKTAEQRQRAVSFSEPAISHCWEMASSQILVNSGCVQLVFGLSLLQITSCHLYKDHNWLFLSRHCTIQVHVTKRQPKWPST